jgi:hypothetical protein
MKRAAKGFLTASILLLQIHDRVTGKHLTMRQAGLKYREIPVKKQPSALDWAEIIRIYDPKVAPSFPKP